jgi:methyl-accepting chemotaxis protein
MKQMARIETGQFPNNAQSQTSNLRWTIRKKMIMILLVAGLLPMGVFAWFSMNQMSQALLDINKERLVSLREEKKLQIENYFKQIEGQASTFSESRMVIDATEKFTSAFQLVESEVADLYGSGEESRLMERYQYQQKNTIGAPSNAASLWMPKNKTSKILQSRYISENSHPIGAKEKLDAAPDSSTYSQVHKKYHPIIRDYLEKFGYYDIFLVEPDTGYIVYSVFKEVDYATSLKDGPYANTGIGRAFNAAMNANNNDFVILDDFFPYAPSYNAAAAFIASPIFDGEKKVGVLIFQAPIDRIDAVMTSNQAWKKVGLGDSGEVYMIGSDMKMRNNSRFLIEQPEEYFKALAEIGVDKAVAEKSEALKTSIGMNPINTQGTAAALKGESGFAIYNDYRNSPVLGAYSPLGILGLKWGIVAEIDEAEAFAIKNTIEKMTLYIGLTLTTLLALTAMWIAGWFAKPILALVSRAQDIVEGNLKQEKLAVNSSDELGLLGNIFNQMMDQLKNFIDNSEQILSGNRQEVDSGFKGDFETSLERMLDQALEKQKADREAAKVTSIVENMPLNIMFADTDLNIQYMNPTSSKTLKTLEKHLPVKVDQMMGQSIDIFHKNPQLQRNILSDPKNLPHRAQIQLGPEILALDVAAIVDQNQNHLGSMVAWQVITEQVATENQAREANEREQKQAEELRTKVDSMLEVVSAAAEGDLSQEVTVSGSDAIGRMGEGLSGFLKKMRTSMSAIGHNAETLASSAEELTAVSQQMAGNAEETSAQSGVVSAASEQVSKNVETVSTGAEEMSASIKEIAQNSNEAARVASEAVKVAETTNTTITQLGESSAEIGQVVKVITSIAEQTNLLALNATIEAARAGEAGKGFAVVANEVKDLANQTAKATEEISGKIGAIQADTQNSVSAIAEITEVINKINDISNTIASAVEEQTATTAEIGRNVGEAARGTAEIAQNITGVAQAAQSTTQGATDTQGASAELSKMAAELQGLVGQFKV